ncbi:MAG: hypothetical protein J0M37_06680 [Ignavibacteria bacterium]|nr:hypothetical protein [Ignavibacteria bacterium]
MKTGNKGIFYCAVIFSLLLISGCKKDEEVQVPVNNEPEINNVKLLEPGNNATIEIFEPLLKWENYGNASGYYAEISQDANFITPAILDTVIPGNSFNVPTGILQTNVYYYWRVKAELGSGSFTAYSEVRRFHIILSPPPPPNLLLPQNGSVDQSFIPLFDWDDTPTAQIYRLQVSSAPSFGTILLDSGNIPVSQLQCPYFILTTGANYFWRVNATNSNGASTGNWSTVFNFSTAPGLTPGTISGTVRFADNNFIQNPYYYVIGAFTVNNWPPVTFTPVYSDSLEIQFINNEFRAEYTLDQVINGNYHLAVFTRSRTTAIGVTYKAVFGCDTARVLFSNCASTAPGTVIMQNGTGINNINILSWADSSKAIF